jgi:hypothetical protein
MWYPAKSAFRAGVVSGTQWNDANIGTSSAAFGIDNRVTGVGGFAAGANNTVNYGWWSTIFGASNFIDSSSQAFLAGNGNLCGSSYCGFAAGNVNTIDKSIAVAIGEGNTSSGWGAMTFGRGLTSAAAGCVVVGMANQPIVGDSTYWVPTDPVFIIGNGTANTASSSTTTTVPVTSNALVVYKSGAIKIPKRQGDIQMGEFGNGNGD